MEQPTPDWLNEEFFTQCLQHEKNNKDIVVTNLTTSPAAPAGNNYGSYIIRVKVEYKNHPNDAESQIISLIVKSEVLKGPVKEMLDKMKVKLKEPTFYKEYLPEVSKITKSDFAPKSLFSPKADATVLEDLKERGFVMADRIKQLDFDHCRLYMEASASFHAVSFAIQKQNPTLIENLGEELDMAGADVFLNVLLQGFKCFADKTKELKRFQKYSKLIEDVSVNLWDWVKDVQKPSGTINTLIQGDPWTTNMMFRYDDNGTVSEIKLLDFQMLRYTCPVNDVLFFLWLSAQHDVRRNRLDELYHIYVDCFNGKLHELGCSERFTFEDFMEQVKRLSPFTFQIAGVSLPLFMDPNPLDFSIFFQKDGDVENIYEKYYNENYCNDYLPQLLEQLELAGVFEHLEEKMKTAKCEKV